MKLTWHNLKVSIAGAKLSHLVQKDRIWDHGSMIEHVKTVFYHLEKEKDKNDEDALKKYMTSDGYEKFKKQKEAHKGQSNREKYSKIKEIAVLEVKPATKTRTDQFTAIVKGYKVHDIDTRSLTMMLNVDDFVQPFSERWSFVRQGDWWLLDGLTRTRFF